MNKTSFTYMNVFFKLFNPLWHFRACISCGSMSASIRCLGFHPWHSLSECMSRRSVCAEKAWVQVKTIDREEALFGLRAIGFSNAVIRWAWYRERVIVRHQLRITFPIALVSGRCEVGRWMKLPVFLSVCVYSSHRIYLTLQLKSTRLHDLGNTVNCLDFLWSLF